MTDDSQFSLSMSWKTISDVAQPPESVSYHVDYLADLAIGAVIDELGLDPALLHGMLNDTMSASINQEGSMIGACGMDQHS